MRSVAMTIDAEHGALLHFVFQTLAYLFGFRYFLLVRKRAPDALAEPLDALWVCTGAILGAAAGATLGYWAQYPEYIAEHLFDPTVILGGKTIVGGLLGGVVGVELTKRVRGITDPTGDTFVYPLILGIAIGRLGCFFAGLEDNTYGNPTSLPWAVTYEDGVPRHPVAVYEMLFVVVIWLALRVSPLGKGEAFELFMMSYLLFRFTVDFMKPPHYPVRSAVEEHIPAAHLYFGALTAIQVICLLGVSYYAREALRIARVISWHK